MLWWCFLKAIARKLYKDVELVTDITQMLQSSSFDIEKQRHEVKISSKLLREFDTLNE